MNNLEKCDKKPWHSHKKPNKNVGKEDNAHECNRSENKSCDLKAYDGSTWVGGMGTEGT